MKIEILPTKNEAIYPRLMRYGGTDERIFLMLSPGKGIGFSYTDMLYQEGLTTDSTYWKDFNGKIILEN